MSLAIDKNTGHSSIVDGQMPDQTADHWQAGDYVHRVQ
jgi:hypothetical protein